MTTANNKPIYRMSSAGKCPRALSAEQLGYQATPAPSWLEQAAEEGNWHEARIKSQLRKEGLEVFGEQLEVKLEYDNFILLGHIDGKVLEGIEEHYSAGSLLLEIKSMSQYQFDRWAKLGFNGFPNYAAQLTCYMAATGLNQALYIVKNRSSGYEQRQTITEYPTFLDDIVNKLEEVTACVQSPDKKLATAEFNPNSLECKRCDYKQLCAPELSKLTPIEQADLESSVIEWRKGKRLVGQGNELMTIAKGAFEEHTRATGIDKWQFGGLGINLIHVHQESYPKKALLECFGVNALEPILEIKDYDQLRIDDLERGN